MHVLYVDESKAEASQGAEREKLIRGRLSQDRLGFLNERLKRPSAPK